MRKAKNRYNKCGSKKEAAKYYNANKYVLKKNAKNKNRNLSEEEEDKKREYQRDRYLMNTSLNEKLKQYQRNYYDSKSIRKWNINFLYSIKTSKKTLKFDVEVNKKEFHVLKHPIVKLSKCK